MKSENSLYESTLMFCINTAQEVEVKARSSCSEKLWPQLKYKSRQIEELACCTQFLVTNSVLQTDALGVF